MSGPWAPAHLPPADAAPPPAWPEGLILYPCAPVPGTLMDMSSVSLPPCVLFWAISLFLIAHPPRARPHLA